MGTRVVTLRVISMVQVAVVLLVGGWVERVPFLEGGVRVPAIISYPAKLQGAVRNQVITAMDWFPTLLGLCGVKQTADAPDLDGYDLLPIIRNADAPSHHKTLHFAWGRGWAVREGTGS